MTLFGDAPDFPTGGPTVQLRLSDSISAAIQKAAPRTTIQLAAGVYNESILIDKEICIQGPATGGAPMATLSARDGDQAVRFASPLACIRNLRISSAESQCTSVLSLESGTAVVDKCVLESPCLPPIVTGANGALYLSGTKVTSGESAITFVSNSVAIAFTNCELTAPRSLGIVASGKSKIRLVNTRLTECGDTAIVVADEAGLEITGGEISGNAGDAIELRSTFDGHVIDGLTISDHEQGAAIVGTGASRLSLSQSIIQRCLSGVVVSKGFTLECKGNQFADLAGEEPETPLLHVIDGATVSLEEDEFSGNCLDAISIHGRSTVTCQSVAISDVDTGIVVTEGSTLRLRGTTLQRIGQCAVMAHENVVVEISDGSKISGCSGIGFLGQNGVSGFVRDSSVVECESAGVHFVDNAEAFAFETVTFGSGRGNGVNLRSAEVRFVKCRFAGCKGASGEEASAVEVRGEDTAPSFEGCVFTGCDLGLSLGGGQTVADNCEFTDNDTGVSVSDGGHVDLANSKFTRNTTGANVVGSPFKFTACSFASHRQVAFWADAGSTGSVKQSTFQQSEMVGALVEGKRTEVEFEECVFAETKKGPGIAIKEDGRARLTGCTVNANSATNVDVQSRGTAKLTRCKVFLSEQGVGLKLKDAGSFVEAVECTITKEKQSAIFLESGAKVEVRECDISECETCGICIRAGCDGALTRNKIHDMEKVGIQVEGGTPSIVQNTFVNCKTYGIHIVSGAEPQVIDNIFQDIGNADVNRE